MISGKNINLVARNKNILKNIFFNCKPSEITVFIGESGAGKTSALRCIAGLQKSYSGELLCDDRDTRKLTPRIRARTIGFAAQNYNLFPNLSVLENCTLALEASLALSKKEALQQARAMLASVGMGNHEHSPITVLSGGQKQRVAIARALCLKPQALVLDEPSSALDPHNVESLGLLLKKLASQNMTVVLSSQDMRFVSLVYDRIFLFRDGEIIESVTRQELQERPSSQIAAFLNH
jgi:ABC-type polar amino acid transport system ATPase subunit